MCGSFSKTLSFTSGNPLIAILVPEVKKGTEDVVVTILL
jgi:hypothetical protein